MSTRWYPIYQHGNPQLRVFLTNFWMKMVKPPEGAPKNMVTFHCSMEMTEGDVKQYLEKIYKVDIASVTNKIHTGKFSERRNTRQLLKAPDYKEATVILDPGKEFEFPSLFPKGVDEGYSEEVTQRKKLEKSIKDEKNAMRKVKGIPLWFAQ